VKRHLGWLVSFLLAAGLLGWGAAPAFGVQCGVWRWPVKTLSDRLESKVNFDPLHKSVDYLLNRDAPSSLSSDTK
jgi:hypothetical protein